MKHNTCHISMFVCVVLVELYVIQWKSDEHCKKKQKNNEDSFEIIISKLQQQYKD